MEKQDFEKGLAEITARAEAKMRQRIAEGAKEEDDTTRERLLKAGYPLRNVSKLPAMYGKGLQKAQQMRERVLTGDCLLLIIGDRGPGKTQIATWLAWQRLKAGKSCGKYLRMFDVYAAIKATYGGEGSEIKYTDGLKTCEFLVLDEIQERSDSAQLNGNLINIIDHRYGAMLTTLLIGNIGKEKLETSISSSIISRAEESGGVICCDWESYRQKGNE